MKPWKPEDAGKTYSSLCSAGVHLMTGLEQKNIQQQSRLCLKRKMLEEETLPAELICDRLD